MHFLCKNTGEQQLKADKLGFKLILKSHQHGWISWERECQSGAQGAIGHLDWRPQKTYLSRSKWRQSFIFQCWCMWLIFLCWLTPRSLELINNSFLIKMKIVEIFGEIENEWSNATSYRVWSQCEREFRTSLKRSRKKRWPLYPLS